MNTREFIASLVGDLAWPATALALVVVLYKPLKAWLDVRPSRIKLGPFEAEWVAQVTKAEVALDSVWTGFGKILEGDSRPEEADPAMAVLRGSAELEQMLSQMLEAAGFKLPKGGLIGLAETASKHGLISDRTVSALEGIATLRNLTAHAPQRISVTQAQEFEALVRTARVAIEKEAELSERLRTGTGNVASDTVEDLLELEGAARVRELALAGVSSVKKRQVAEILAKNGHVEEAIDVALEIPNRAEARNVGLAALRFAIDNPEASDTVRSGLSRLKRHLPSPQRRDMREAARNQGFELGPDWDEADPAT